jgi:hypothetical protein
LIMTASLALEAINCKNGLLGGMRLPRYR